MDEGVDGPAEPQDKRAWPWPLVPIAGTVLALVGTAGLLKYIWVFLSHTSQLFFLELCQLATGLAGLHFRRGPAPRFGATLILSSALLMGASLWSLCRNYHLPLGITAISGYWMVLSWAMALAVESVPCLGLGALLLVFWGTRTSLARGDLSNGAAALLVVEICYFLYMVGFVSVAREGVNRLFRALRVMGATGMFISLYAASFSPRPLVEAIAPGALAIVLVATPVALLMGFGLSRRGVATAGTLSVQLALVFLAVAVDVQQPRTEIWITTLWFTILMMGRAAVVARDEGLWNLAVGFFALEALTRFTILGVHHWPGWALCGGAGFLLLVAAPYLDRERRRIIRRWAVNR